MNKTRILRNFYFSLKSHNLAQNHPNFASWVGVFWNPQDSRPPLDDGHRANWNWCSLGWEMDENESAILIRANCSMAATSWAQNCHKISWYEEICVMALQDISIAVTSTHLELQLQWPPSYVQRLDDFEYLSSSKYCAK